LLGLGADGHTAGLFPCQTHDIPTDAADVVAVLDAPAPFPLRVSLSATRLSRTHAALFLVVGEAKRDAVTRWRRGEDIPARAIRPHNGVDVLVESGLLAAGPSTTVSKGPRRAGGTS
jgi:6-phosphogluconolactonase